MQSECSEREAPGWRMRHAGWRAARASYARDKSEGTFLVSDTIWVVLVKCQENGRTLGKRTDVRRDRQTGKINNTSITEKCGPILEMDQEFGKSTTHRLWSSYTPWNKTQPEVCYQKISDGTKIPSSTGYYMRNAGIVEKCGTIFLKWIRILEPRPSTGYKGDILLEHRHNLKSAITKKMLEPKSHQSRAIACETLAL
jgi:hypothetical protein